MLRRSRRPRAHLFAVAGALLVALGWACGSSTSDGGATAGDAGGSSDDATSPTDGAHGGDGGAAREGEAPPPDASTDGAIAPSGCGPTSPLAAGDQTRAITVGGLARSYILHVPTGYTGKTAVPLVFDFHPLQVDATTWKIATGWPGVADTQGFLLVWPQGIGGSWNAGRCCDPAHQQAVDDVAFVRAIAAEVSGAACVDEKRIYATGCSNGGGMAYRVACDAADVVAAVAPVDFDCITGPTNSPSCGSCNPARPISVSQFRATGDTAVPYDGGPTSVVAGLVFPGAQANFADWGARNGCTGAPQTDGTYTLCSTYPSCAAGVETTLCTIPLGSHCANYIPFGMAQVAWEMLSKHALP